MKLSPKCAPRVLAMMGKKYGRLTVLELAGYRKQPSGSLIEMVLCSCDCGKSNHVAMADHVLYGNAESCGCLISESITKRLTKHGFAPLKGRRRKIYTTWQGINKRCHNLNDSHFKHYGGRGIDVCERWSGKHGFINFLADMGEPKQEMSIERRDNNKGYSKENCYWLPKPEQAKNRLYNWRVSLNGEVMSARDACRQLGVSPSLIAAKLRNTGKGKREIHDLSTMGFRKMKKWEATPAGKLVL